MTSTLVAILLLQSAAASNQAASATSQKAPTSVGVSVSAGATVLAPVRVISDNASGALKIEGPAGKPKMRRDPAGTVWIEFS